MLLLLNSSNEADNISDSNTSLLSLLPSIWMIRLVFGSERVYLANLDRYVEHSFDGTFRAISDIVLLNSDLSNVILVTDDDDDDDDDDALVLWVLQLVISKEVKGLEYWCLIL